MKNTYMKAQYRIKDAIYNEGYICINESSIIGLFCLDKVKIALINGKLHFYLIEYEPESDSYYSTNEFISIQTIDKIKCPSTYLLRLKSNHSIFLSLTLMQELNDSDMSSSILQQFENFYSK